LFLFTEARVAVSIMWSNSRHFRLDLKRPVQGAIYGLFTEADDGSSNPRGDDRERV
jgi:hypothetical protein